MRIPPFAVIAAAAVTARADTVDLKFMGTGAGQSVNITGPGYSGGVFAGQLKHAFSDGTGTAAGWTGTRPTFCIEVAQYVNSSGSEYELKDLSEVPGLPQAMGTQRAEAVRVLFDLAGGAQFQTGSSAASLSAAAFQVALWELVFDFEAGDSSSIDLSLGAFKLNTTGSVQTTAKSWLDQILANYGTGSAPLIGLSSDSGQDQVVMVPLPAPVLIGLAGLMGVAGLGRLRRR